ncbi:DUF2789 domain-containing protein [Curvibacter sp. APW13]|uniref:DUF2789 domain-containing protein n=1 Tax=Curvibacter sp. APW13 TaxID=3077236 RepID=UPI0028DE3413|nr:DUF2789 domain-containing protein [Curvibacter sp. APW13]MDT8992540.1 DUF2789 domain-containing protein [Curvibacter sp. APW13]
METHQHDLSHLFRQLGYSGAPEHIDQFIATHRLEQGVSLPDAVFWTPAQAHFLRRALADDSDWAEVVDMFAVRLTR